jgi:hypothetical protein
MSTEPESFLARWSRLKRTTDRDAEAPAAEAAPVVPADSPEKPGDEGVEVSRPVSAPALARDPAATTETPLPSIESLDGLSSDYQAFFQQPVDEGLRRAALKKLFADPHFNKMDMLDVYVDDYTQFEPLPASMRTRLPSARDFLLDSERAVPDAADMPTKEAPEAVATAADEVRDPAESHDAGDDARGLASDKANAQSPSALPAEQGGTPGTAQSAKGAARIADEPSTSVLPPDETIASDPSST